jgi:PPOX class probable F420-dependent enzyme
VSPPERELLGASRTATLATVGRDGRPRLVPICFVVIDDVVWTPLDEKPKRASDVRQLGRVRDIERDSRVTLLVDRWSEEWSELAWIRVEGRAELADSEPAVVEALRAKYPQYVGHDLESRPLIAITIERVTSWAWSATNGDAAGRPVE